MAAADRPQITLITPPIFDLQTFPDQLAAVMDTVEIACLRLSLATWMKTASPAPPMPAVWSPMPATSPSSSKTTSCSSTATASTAST